MNRLGPKPAQVGPTAAESRPRPGNFAERASRFWLNRTRSLYYCFESLTDCTNALGVLSIHNTRSPTALKRGRAPTSKQTGQKGQRLGFLSSRHQIQVLRTLSPQSISYLVICQALPARTVHDADRCSCSNQFMAVKFDWMVWKASRTHENVRTSNRAT